MTNEPKKPEPKDSNNKDTPPEIERLRKLVAARFNQQAAEKAVWQRRVRGYLVRALADMRQLKHLPRQEELAQYVLETLAEQSNDPDYLAVIGPFSRNLPDAYRDRWQAREIVRRFQQRQENKKAGRWLPLEPMPENISAEPPEPLSTGIPMTDKPETSAPTPEAEAARKQLEQRHALQDSYAKVKAEWQADLRLRFNAFMRDYAWRNHPPETVELAQFLLQLVAEQTGDYDVLALLLPFAERLPHELQARREDGRIASEFLMIGHERRKYGPNGKPKVDDE